MKLLLLPLVFDWFHWVDCLLNIQNKIIITFKFIFSQKKKKKIFLEYNLIFLKKGEGKKKINVKYK